MKPPKILVLDFDGTITTKDTIEDLAQAALAWRRTDEGGCTDLSDAWQQVKEAYVHDLAHYAEKATPEEQRVSWPAESAYLDGLAAVEERSLARVKESGIFRGIADGGDLLFEAGRQAVANGSVGYKDGFEALMKAVVDKGVSVYVLSVNWSASWIRGVLAPLDQHVTVIANEIDPDGDIYATPDALPGQQCSGEGGRPRRTLSTARDKLAALTYLGQKTEHDLHGSYVGDSATDLACLEARGGLVMAPGRDGGGRLLDALRRIGAEVPRLSQPLQDRVCNDRDAKICWVGDFDEMLRSWDC